MGTDHVVGLLKVANNDLPALENRYEKLQRNVDYLESRTRREYSFGRIERSDTKYKSDDGLLSLNMSERGKENATFTQTEYKFKCSSNSV